MSEEFDVYQPCPCGSGKKIKFCCQAILPEMVRIAELQKEGQIRQVAQALDALEKRGIKEPTSRAWIKATRAMMLIAEGQLDEAEAQLKAIFAESPDNPQAVLLQALITLHRESYPAAMRAVYKAFEVADGRFSTLASHLATVMTEVLASKNHAMAAIEHLALAVRLEPENTEAAELAAEAERDRRAAYPLRVHYMLAPFSSDEKFRSQDEAARRLVHIGCYSDAAKTFGQIARHEPNHSGLWWNMALCHAWAGEDPLAEQAFKASASNQPDQELAAECLVLAQLISQPTGPSGIERLMQKFKVTSVGRLLTTLDQLPRLSRKEFSEAQAEFSEGRLAAIYNILDREKFQGAPEELTLDNAARVAGELAIYDAGDAENDPAVGILTCTGRDLIGELLGMLSATGAEMEPEGEPLALRALAKDMFQISFLIDYPRGITRAKLRELEQARWNRVIHEIWPQTPLDLLQGKTPAQAAGIPELKAALIAAVLRLEIFAELNGTVLDRDAIRDKYGLGPTPLLDIAPENDPLRRSIFEVRRLNLSKLTDDQLLRTLMAFSQLQIDSSIDAALREVMVRPQLGDKIDLSKICLRLADICQRNFRLDEALEWIARGKEILRNRKSPLDELLLWEIQELTLRSHRENDPGILELATRIWNYYRPKLPEASESIAMLLNRLQLPGPWNAPVDVLASEPLAAAGSVTAGGIWTPESQPAAAGEGSKLWLPGQ